VRLSDRGVRLVAPRAEAVLSGAEPPPDGLSAEDRGVLGQLRVSLADWLPLVDRVPPSELLDRIVADAAYAFELRGARRPQARENLKKIRAMARRLQNRGYATMARVAEHLARLSAGDESNAAVDALDSVNLMTVHAAKGLEFPIVFVTNLHRGTGGHGDPVVIVPARAGGRQLVSVGGSLPEADDALRERDREETKRLLYVAVTRARERLYLGAVLKDGRFQAKAGSLGEVLPASLRDAFARAATGGVSVEWRPENGSARLLGVAQPDAGGSPSPMADRDDAAVAPATPIVDVEPLIDTIGDRHEAAAAYARSLAPGFTGEPGVPADEPMGVDPALVGTIVHRLFQVSGHGASRDTDWLAERARAFAAGRDDVVGSNSAEVVAFAVEAFLRLRRRTDVASLVDDAVCEYELPFSLRLEAPDGGGPTGPPVVIRGSIDCLARRPDGTVTVLELKTGRRRDWHQHQLDLYVRATRCLFPGVAVEGRLVYLDEGESPAATN
jgi:ATP-dependent exoDNAse (exonuclease V) beta subunit